MRGQVQGEYFEKVYNETYNEILKFVLVRCRKLCDVSDLIQKTYVDFFKCIKNNKYNIENPEAFLKQIAKRQLNKYYIFNKRIAQISDIDNEPEIDFAEKSFEDDFLDEFSNKEIWKIIEEEELVSKKILVLHFCNELTLKEIANELEISESTVKSKMYRSLERLRKKLESGKGGGGIWIN